MTGDRDFAGCDMAAIELLLRVSQGLGLEVSVQHVGLDCYVATLLDGRFYDCGLPFPEDPQAEQMVEIGMRRELINGMPNAPLLKLWVEAIEEHAEVPVASLEPIELLEPGNPYLGRPT